MVVAYFGLSAFTNIYFFFVVGAIFGMGQGLYSVVDLALAIDCLPSSSSAAKDMGLWGNLRWLFSVFNS